MPLMENLILSLTIAARALPQPRPRTTRQRGRVVTISTPAGSPLAVYSQAISLLARQYRGGLPPETSPVELHVRAFYARPTRQSKLPRGWESRAIGDFDNVAKPIADALQGIAIANDCQVARSIVERIACGPGDPQQVEIDLIALADDPPAPRPGAARLIGRSARRRNGR